MVGEQRSGLASSSALTTSGVVPRWGSATQEPRQAILRRKKMRGGLGRTLLTAFLLLALGPLSAMSIYAINRTRQESLHQRGEQLALLAESYRAQILAASNRWDGARSPALAPGWFFSDRGAPLRSAPGASTARPEWVDRARLTAWQVGGEPRALWVVAPWGEGWSATVLPLVPLLDTLRLPESLRGTSIYLQEGDSITPLSPWSLPLPDTTRARLLTPSEESAIVVKPADGRSVQLWARAPLADGLTLWVVRPEGREPTVPDRLAAALVAAALLAALATTVAAALVTRQITCPLYELTQTAVKIARGDLKQRAQVEQDNELGILALAFNTMTDQLHETLATLEERVEQRTEELRRANAEIQARAHQLQLSVEIGAVVSRIHELEQLLAQATRLIGTSFGYRDVSIWLLGRRPGRDPNLTRRASLRSPEEEPGRAAVCVQLADAALQHGSAQLDPERHTLALPLRLADNALGSLVVERDQPFQEPEQQPLQILADTVAVAIENARASEMEREALAKLKQIESGRSHFLGEMSHELSTALNSIIGFSHLLLKEVEGPLTDMQRSDLTYINRNGTHLLSLLDGLLDVIDGGP